MSRQSKSERILVWILFVNTRRKLASTHKHWAPKPQPSAVLFRLLAKEVRTKRGHSRALVVKGHVSNPWHRLRPLPAAPLVVRRRRCPGRCPRHRSLCVARCSGRCVVVHCGYLIVVPRPMPARLRER